MQTYTTSESIHTTTIFFVVFQQFWRKKFVGLSSADGLAHIIYIKKFWYIHLIYIWGQMTFMFFPRALDSIIPTEELNRALNCWVCRLAWNSKFDILDGKSGIYMFDGICFPILFSWIFRSSLSTVSTCCVSKLLSF